MNSNTILSDKKDAKSNNLIYCVSLFFLLPTLYSLIFTMPVNFRILHYIGIGALSIFLYVKKEKLKISSITFSSTGYLLFFLSTLVAFLYVMYTQYYFFTTYGSDFSVFESLLQNALVGRWGYSDYVGFYHFATHQNYVLLLVLPVYALLKSALFLQLLAGVIIWLAGVILWLIAREEINSILALFLTVAFYLCAGTVNALQTNFHPELFFPLAIFLLYYCYKYAKSYFFLLVLLLCLSIKEDSALYMLGFGYLAWKEKHYTKLWLTASITSLVIAINLFIVQPYFVAKSGLINPPTLLYWASFGHTKSQILLNLISSPLQIMSRMFNYNSGFWRIYLYCLFIPLFDIFTLFSSILGLVLFTSSDYFPPHNLGLYYGLQLSSLVFIGLIRIIEKHKKTYELWFFFGLLVLYPLWGAGWLQFNVDKENRYAELSMLKEKLAHDFPGYSICPSERLYPYFSVYEFSVHTLSYKEEKCIRVFTKNDTMSVEDRDYLKDIETKYNCSNTRYFIFCQ